MDIFEQIIVNQHKKSRVFLYSFNTLSLLKRYCILFLYQYNKDNKKKKEKPDGVKRNISNGDPAKEKRAARRI